MDVRQVVKCTKANSSVGSDAWSLNKFKMLPDIVIELLAKAWNLIFNDQCYIPAVYQASFQQHSGKAHSECSSNCATGSVASHRLIKSMVPKLHTLGKQLYVTLRDLVATALNKYHKWANRSTVAAGTPARSSSAGHGPPHCIEHFHHISGKATKLSICHLSILDDKLSLV